MPRVGKTVGELIGDLVVARDRANGAWERTVFLNLCVSVAMLFGRWTPRNTCAVNAIPAESFSLIRL